MSGPCLPWYLAIEYYFYFNILLVFLFTYLGTQTEKNSTTRGCLKLTKNYADPKGLKTKGDTFFVVVKHSCCMLHIPSFYQVYLLLFSLYIFLYFFIILFWIFCCFSLVTPVTITKWKHVALTHWILYKNIIFVSFLCPLYVGVL